MLKERFRLLVDHAPVCIHEIGLDGRISAMNPAGLAMMGLENEAAVCGMAYLDAVGDADRARITDLMARALEGHPAHFEFHSSGDEPRYYASNFIPMHDDDGRFVGLMGVSQDVTQRRRAERDLLTLNESLEQQVRARTAELQRLNDRLSRQNQELTEFARAVSHDLRSPLTSILGTASLLELSDRPPDEAEKLARIVQSGARMARMIDELLALARVGDSVEPVTEPADLEQVLAEVCAGLAHEIEATGARVTHDPLPTVHASTTEQHRLLQNLVGNALKFRGADQPAVTVSAEPLDGGWAVSVRDNGIGVPEGEQEAIFGVFYRATGARDLPGTGVGLSICKKLVEARGGTLRAASAPGGGTLFTYTVPAPAG